MGSKVNVLPNLHLRERLTALKLLISLLEMLRVRADSGRTIPDAQGGINCGELAMASAYASALLRGCATQTARRGSTVDTSKSQARPQLR